MGNGSAVGMGSAVGIGANGGCAVDARLLSSIQPEIKVTANNRNNAMK